MTCIGLVAFKVSGKLACNFWVHRAFFSHSMDTGAAANLMIKEVNHIVYINTPKDGLPDFSKHTSGATLVKAPKITIDATNAMGGSVDLVGKLGIDINFPKKTPILELWSN